MRIDVVKIGDFFYIRKKTIFDIDYWDKNHSFWWSKLFLHHATRFEDIETAEQAWNDIKETVVKRLK